MRKEERTKRELVKFWRKLLEDLQVHFKRIREGGDMVMIQVYCKRNLTCTLQDVKKRMVLCIKSSEWVFKNGLSCSILVGSFLLFEGKQGWKKRRCKKWERINNNKCHGLFDSGKGHLSSGLCQESYTHTVTDFNNDFLTCVSMTQQSKMKETGWESSN